MNQVKVGVLGSVGSQVIAETGGYGAAGLANIGKYQGMTGTLTGAKAVLRQANKLKLKK